MASDSIVTSSVPIVGTSPDPMHQLIKRQNRSNVSGTEVHALLNSENPESENGSGLIKMTKILNTAGSTNEVSEGGIEEEQKRAEVSHFASDIASSITGGSAGLINPVLIE